MPCGKGEGRERRRAGQRGGCEEAVGSGGPAEGWGFTSKAGSHWTAARTRERERALVALACVWTPGAGTGGRDKGQIFYALSLPQSLRRWSCKPGRGLGARVGASTARPGCSRA